MLTCILFSLLLIGLLILSSISSASEAAYFSISEHELAADMNHPSTQNVLRLLQFPNRLLANILIFNNLVNVAIITVSTYFLWEISPNPSTWMIVLHTIISSAILVLFCETAPKIYGNQNNLVLARNLASFWLTIHVLFRPISSMLLILGRIWGNNFLQERTPLSLDQLYHALALTTEQDTSAEEKDLLKSVMSFGSLTVKQIMRPRTDIIGFDMSLDFQEVMEELHKFHYARFPVYSESIDKIEGVIYVKDLVHHIGKDKNFNWHTLIRKCLFIPENKKLTTLLTELQERKTQLAIVVDEYGGTSGIITLEDVIEEIVGDITDEFGQDKVLYNKIDDQTYIFEGKIPLHDFCKILDQDSAIFENVKGDSESLGGVLLSLQKRLPQVGETINFKHFSFKIVSADSRKIKQVQVSINKLPVS